MAEIKTRASCEEGARRRAAGAAECDEVIEALFAQARDADDEQPGDPVPAVPPGEAPAQSTPHLWALVLHHDRLIGVTFLAADGRWMPLALDDRRARQLLEDFLRDDDGEIEQ